jgi:hypothetical protein
MSDSDTSDTDEIDPDAEVVQKKTQSPAPAWTGHRYDSKELLETPVMDKNAVGDAFSPVFVQPPSDSVANRPKEVVFLPYNRRVLRPKTPETPLRSNAPWDQIDLSEAERQSLENAKK